MFMQAREESHGLYRVGPTVVTGGARLSCYFCSRSSRRTREFRWIYGMRKETTRRLAARMHTAYPTGL